MSHIRPGMARKALVMAASLLVVSRQPLAAQSLTTGGLTATVLDERGKPMVGVSVTLERGSATVQNQTTDSRGVAVFLVVPPGHYSLLTEQLGYRPLRSTDLLIPSGGMSEMTVRLSTAVPGNTVELRPAGLTHTRSGVDRLVSGSELSDLDRRRDLADISRNLSQVDAPRDGRDGFVTSAQGLPNNASRLVVDGFDELLMRHAGLRSEPASAPLFARAIFDQARVVGFGRDIEWPGAAGSVLSGATRSGSGAAKILPWFGYSGAKLGGKKLDNPADSSSSSFDGGFLAGGGIKGDTGSWAINAEYRQSKEPSANPFEIIAGGTDPTAAIQAAVQSLGHGDVSSWLAPTVRSWKGGSVLGRFDWQFDRKSSLAVRAGMASWTEDNPLVGTELANGAGSRLEAKDFSVGAAFTTSGEDWLSETRLGVRSGQRDWTTSATPYTVLAGDGLAFGGSATVPGNFKNSQLQLTEAYHYHLGAHQLKAVADFRKNRVTNDWLPYGAGRFDFGDVASFAAGRGAFVQSARSGAAPTVAVLYPSLGVQDAWQVSPRLQFIGGFRLESQKLPKALIAPNVAFGSTAGVNTALQPTEKKGGRLAPSGGLVWTSDAAATTTFRFDVGVVPVHLDLGALTEAMQNNGSVTVSRGTGVLPWPNPTAAAMPVVGPVLTMFNANVKSPKATKGDVALTRRLGGDLILSVHGGYDHTDYLLRRADLNLIQTPLSTASDGRPIYGVLEQYNSLLTAAVGSNRRFRNFDKAYMLSSSGFADYTEVGVSLERRVIDGLSVNLSYTWSRTRDNLPGQLSNDPADQLSPLPGATGHGTWDEGRSDFDVPSRAALMAAYSTGSFSLSARFRYRSGLPFTPGFANGVDANADGALGNDPAPLDNAIPGMTALAGQHGCLSSSTTFFAQRNSCRDPSVQSLDLHLGVPLPFGKSRRVALLVDAFNVVSTDVGLFDHAAVSVDPAASLTFNSAGQLVLPLKANDNFGHLLSRRGEARTVRIGFRVEN